MKGVKGFQPGHVPLGACLRLSRQKRCCRGHEFKRVYVDASGQKHRWCLECSNMMRRRRKDSTKWPREPNRIVREYFS